jgi:2,5-diamino-6-(ribosylamino)-4(3H)-pyrimidinone 5'-phosphate reductase
MTRPHVVVHVAISLDGSTAGFDADVGRFYALARTWNEDVTLAGADTILAQEKALSAAPRPGPTADAPLLAVVDGRGRVTQWAALRDCGHWRGVVALRAEGRPAATGEAAVTELVTPGERVDLAEALGMLADRENARVIRVDSGGTLTGALLRARLVDEISLLVHPCLAGSGDRRWHGPDPAPPLPLEPLAGEQLDDLVWLRYRVRRDT